MAIDSLAREANTALGGLVEPPAAAKIYSFSAAKPKILFVTSEIADLVQTGGLAAVSASLPRALKPFCEARVLLPGYPSVIAKAGPLTHVAEFPAYAGLPACGLAAATLADGLCVYVVQCDALYARDGAPYADLQGREHPDNDLRFARLCLAAAELVGRGARGWRPDVVHLNDWPTALTAGYLAWRDSKRRR